MSGPLHGIRVLDLTSMGMGPYATGVMADLGADVVKIESPLGDPVRNVGPMRHTGMGATFLHLNRNKRSVVLDLKHPQGVQALLTLARGSDALVYNVRPPAMARLGLDYASVAAVNPRIVYCGVYGFSQAGPYGEKPPYDDLIQGLTAMPSLEARLGGNPRYVPLALADQAVGLVATYAVLAALVSRASTGQGQAVEVPMFESMAQFVLACHLCGQTFDPPLGEAGFVRHLAPERRPFPTSDGFVCLVPYSDEQWFRFFDLIGRPDLRVDPRFSNLADRTRNIGQPPGAHDRPAQHRSVPRGGPVRRRDRRLAGRWRHPQRGPRLTAAAEFPSHPLNQGKDIMSTRGLYFEEFNVGDVFKHAVTRTTTETDNLLFSVLTHNTQPLHLDEEFCKGTIHGTRLVNSIFTLGLTVGVGVTELTLGTTLGNLGFEEITFPNPVKIGDTLRAETVILAKRESKSRTDSGIVSFEHHGYNQRGQLVCKAKRTGLMMKRPAL